MLEIHNINDVMKQVLITYLPLITQRVCDHLCGHALLIEDPQFALIINFYQLLTASGGERDIELDGKSKERLTLCSEAIVVSSTNQG